MRSRAALSAALVFVGLAGIALGFLVSSGTGLLGGDSGSRGRDAPAGRAAPVASPASVPGSTSPVAPPPTPPVTRPDPGTVPAPGVALPATPPSGGVSFAHLARELSPAVVHIFVRVGHQSPFYGYQNYAATGQGTGFIVSPDGLILTNDHVVGRASAIKVRLADGDELSGQVVGTDPNTDIALIKVEATKPLPTVRLGDSDRLEIGEWVLAIGNPFGLDHTVTAGIVSAKGRREVIPGRRSADRYYDFIQTDASINPGNSGGPLFNTSGEVVGINTAISAQGQGLAFAIPINMAKAIVPLLQQHHRVPRSWIGVTIAPVTPAVAADLGLSDTDGTLIGDVVPGSPAHRAGLKPGEVILEFEGKPIKRHDDLPWLVSMAGIGRTVPVAIADRGGRREVQVTLEEKPQ